MLQPGDCSPSRSVVSKISTRSGSEIMVLASFLPQAACRTGAALSDHGRASAAFASTILAAAGLAATRFATARFATARLSQRHAWQPRPQGPCGVSRAATACARAASPPPARSAGRCRRRGASGSSGAALCSSRGSTAVRTAAAHFLQHLAHLVLPTRSLMMRGPRVRSPYLAVSLMNWCILASPPSCSRSTISFSSCRHS